MNKKEYEIIIDDVIRKKWHPGYSRSKRNWKGQLIDIPITEVVIHGTAGLGTYEWVRDGGRAAEYRKGVALFHYIIEYDIDMIREIEPTEKAFYHSSSGRHDLGTIGIEIENPSKLNRTKYLDRQYEQLNCLILDYLVPKYPTIKNIVGHNFNATVYSNKPKPECPGPLFDWTKIQSELDRRKIQYTIINKEAIKLI